MRRVGCVVVVAAISLGIAGYIRVFVWPDLVDVARGKSSDGRYECVVTEHRFWSGNIDVWAVLRDSKGRKIGHALLASDSAVYVQYYIEWEQSNGDMVAAIVNCFNTGDVKPSNAVRMPVKN